MKLLLICILVFSSNTKKVWAYPSICSVVNTPSFRSSLNLQMSISVCGFPPRPCVHISYSIPQYFIEVVSNPKDSFFTGLPGAATQLATTKEAIPFGAEDDNGSYSYHAHTLNIPHTMWAFSGMPCGGALWDNMCFTSMSEHLGSLWKTGSADSMQPAWLAWSAAPKACLIKGAITSISGESRASGYPANSAMCSTNRSWMKKFPPSGQPVCTGWGINFPRYGTVTNADQTTASLVIAARMRSLGSEVFQSVPTTFTDKFQMIFPQSSSSFKEGQNIGILRAKRVSEMGRLWNAKPKNYLYAVWKRVGCTKDIPYIATTHAWLAGMQAACRGLK